MQALRPGTSPPPFRIPLCIKLLLFASGWSASGLSVSPMRLNMRESNGEARRVLSLAWPVMLTSLNWTLLHLIDVAVVGQVSTHELGALAAGRALTYVPIIVGIARSEEHTSELQSLMRISYAVFCLKKKSTQK